MGRGGRGGGMRGGRSGGGMHRGMSGEDRGGSFPVRNGGMESLPFKNNTNPNPIELN